eukprot:1746142-Amphidinium_carterae.1
MREEVAKLVQVAELTVSEVTNVTRTCLTAVRGMAGVDKIHKTQNKQINSEFDKESDKTVSGN